MLLPQLPSPLPLHIVWVCADILKRAPEGSVLAPRRVAFINEKGGSGKTTLASNFAAYLALRRGRRILAIDMDPQGQLGKVLGVEGRLVRRSAIDLLLDPDAYHAALEGKEAVVAVGSDG